MGKTIAMAQLLLTLTILYHAKNTLQLLIITVLIITVIITVMILYHHINTNDFSLS